MHFSTLILGTFALGFLRGVAAAPPPFVEIQKETNGLCKSAPKLLKKVAVAAIKGTDDSFAKFNFSSNANLTVTKFTRKDEKVDRAQGAEGARKLFKEKSSHDLQTDVSNLRVITSYSTKHPDDPNAAVLAPLETLGPIEDVFYGVIDEAVKDNKAGNRVYSINGRAVFNAVCEISSLSLQLGDLRPIPDVSPPQDDEDEPDVQRRRGGPSKDGGHSS